MLNLTWSSRRKLLYAAVVFVIALIVLFFVWKTFFAAAPTCFDNKQDGDETGVDCGGSCAPLCQNQSQAPIVLWARAFPNGVNDYTAAAYIQNDNAGAGARAVQYSFQLFDADNNLIVEHTGTTDLPPIQTIPIIEPNIDVGNRIVAHTLFSFESLPVWSKVPVNTIPTLVVGEQSLSSDGSRLSATVSNTSTTDASNFTLAAVLFDAQGVARAASKSTIPLLPGRSSTTAVFTWPQSMQNIVRAEITVLPSF